MNQARNSYLLSVAGMLLVLGAAVVVVMFMVLGWYAYPAADDFCMSAGVRQSGLLSHIWYHYQEWSGRYTGNTLYAFYPLLFGLFNGYRYLAALLIVGLFFSIAFLLSRLFRLPMSAPSVWVVGTCLLAVYLLGLRHTASSLYWMAGSLSYQSAHILILLALGLMLQLHERQRYCERSTRMALLLCILLGMGTNETSMLALAAIIGLGFIIDWYQHGRPSATWILILLVGLAGFAVVYFAPGNTVRESTFEGRHDLWHSLRGSWKMGTWSLVAWIGQPVFVISTLLTPFAAGLLHKHSSRRFDIPKSVIVLLLAITFSFPFLLQFPAWWSMGGWPPPRTVDAIFFVFMLSWFASIAAISLHFGLAQWFVDYSRRGSTKQALSIALMLLLVVAALTSSHLNKARVDLVRYAAPFHRYMMQRNEQVEQSLATGQYFLTLPVYQGELPRSIYFNDIRKDPRDWRNICFAQYFGLQGVRREK
jgi:hypothetical protein